MSDRPFGRLMDSARRHVLSGNESERNAWRAVGDYMLSEMTREWSAQRDPYAWRDPWKDER